MAAGVAVFIAVLLPGALWYKGAQRSVAATAALEATSMLQKRASLAAQGVAGNLNVIGPWLWDRGPSAPLKVKSKRVRRDLPFDVVIVFSHDRSPVDGFRIMSDGSGLVDLSNEAANLLFAADSGVFDRVSESRSVAGVFTVEGKPLLIAAEQLSVDSENIGAGFILVGRWLKTEHLKGSLDLTADTLKFYSLADDDNLPERVKGYIPMAQRNNGFFYELDRDGRGSLYSIINDVNGRPVLIVESAWEAPWRASGNAGFGMFFAAAAVAGIGAWSLLIWGDARSRRRVRRFDGLSSLNVDQLKTLVEAFPGYAFVLKSSMDYVAVSRVLAGVTGQEPSYYAGQKFGSMASEKTDTTMERLFLDLRDPKRWPKMSPIKHSVEGLGEQFEFVGSAHYLAKQDLILVILITNNNANAKHSTPKNSAKSTLNKKEVA